MFDKLIDIIIQIWDNLKPVVFVLEYEEAVLFRFGKFHKAITPGWYFKIPFIDDYHPENVKDDTMSISPITITTLDNKTISIGCEFDFFISDVYLSLVETNDWRTNLFDICMGIMSDHLEDCNWEDIKKKVIKNQIEKRIAKRALEMGITVSNFNFTHKTITKSITLYKEL